MDTDACLLWLESRADNQRSTVDACHVQAFIATLQKLHVLRVTTMQMTIAVLI